MAYEKQDGDWQVITGGGGNKPVFSFKLKLGEKEYDLALWQKKFDWGVITSGNIGTIKALYCQFLKFTVKAIRYYQNQLNETDKPAAQPKQDKPKPIDRNTLLR